MARWVSKQQTVLGRKLKLSYCTLKKNSLKKCLPIVVSIPARIALPVKGSSLPNHTFVIPRLGQQRGPEISQIRLLIWLKTKNSHPPSQLVKTPMTTQLHLLWEAEGSKFVVVKDRKHAYAGAKSPATYTEHLPLLREPDQSCGLFSECLNSEGRSNAQVLHQLRSFACPVQAFPEDSLQGHCRYSQGGVFGYV